ncbi:hypothetical protein EDD85DRAFT_795075 [Armillaria nabsnona]|nr:hypothetical protein EDD85DRAFT_795075 [Armillaria nabsnona]
MQNECYLVKRGKQSREANVNWLGTHNINIFPVVRKNTHLILREKNIFLGLSSGKLTMLIQGVLYSKGRLCCVLQGGITIKDGIEHTGSNRVVTIEPYTKWIEIAKEHYVPAVQGICAIAERKVVHRDLKAQHIMITSMSPWQVVHINSALRDPICIEASELLLSEK